jgi:DNA-binding response OmpR family regulator
LAHKGARRALRFRQYVCEEIDATLQSTLPRDTTIISGLPAPLSTGTRSARPGNQRLAGLRPPLDGQAGLRDRPRILVADDDAAIRTIIGRVLDASGFDAVVCRDGAEALQAFQSTDPALVILDMRMPGKDGLTVCGELRAGSAVPIVMLSGLEDEETAAAALDMGADDYVRKPFGVSELVARIHAILRRSGAGAMPEAGVLTTGNVSIDVEQRTVTYKGREVDLTRTEFGLLVYLLSNPSRVLTHDQILEKVWGTDFIGSRHVLRVCVNRLRKKFRDADALALEALNGVGYRLRKAA